MDAMKRARGQAGAKIIRKKRFMGGESLLL